MYEVHEFQAGHAPVPPVKYLSKATKNSNLIGEYHVIWSRR